MYTFEEAKEIINKAIFSQSFKEEPIELYEPIEYILASGGKRLRPALAVMACNLFSDNIEKAIMPSLGIEIFHNFTLLHDDIMDHADIRRNQETVHKKWNENTAILSGDAMAIKAYHYISECDPLILKEILPIFNKTAIQVCEGQQFDLNYEELQFISMGEYLQMIELKTSVLIAASLQIGALIGGATTEDAKLLYEFGRNIGLAFQLQDDMLDVFGDPKIFGKNIGGDIVSNKKTFLLIKAFETATDETLVQLKKYVQAEEIESEEKIKGVSDIYKQLNIEEITKTEINNFYKKAIKFLDKITIDDSRKKEVRDLADEMTARVK